MTWAHRGTLTSSLHPGQAGLYCSTRARSSIRLLCYCNRDQFLPSARCSALWKYGISLIVIILVVIIIVIIIHICNLSENVRVFWFNLLVRAERLC